MMEPDLSRLYGSWDAVNWKLAQGRNVMYLCPGWWLSVLVMISDDASIGIDYELTDRSFAPLFATAEQLPHYENRGMDQRITGIRLPEPLPNFNAAHGYALVAKADQACTVKVLQLWHMEKR